jgi:hypothetical protein
MEGLTLNIETNNHLVIIGHMGNVLPGMENVLCT